jgi:cell fate (sporulation/competence/biofilm development) regulator YlbF (YheA/YmcA/DUF963 family)
LPVDTKQIMDAAEKLGELLKQHPTVERYKSAQKAISEDAEAGRLLAEFERQLENLGRQEQQGRPVTDAQRLQLENLQAKIVSHIKIKNFNLAQVEFIDLLQKIRQAYQRQVVDGAASIPSVSRPPANLT